MGKIIKRIATVLTVFFIAAGAYLGYEIHAARELTLNKVIPMLAGPDMILSRADLSPRQLEILLKVEDPAFFSHKGVDFSTPGAGITTITQGLVKLLYFDKFKPGIAKIKQTLIAAFALDSLVSKDNQLKLFLNLAWFGTDNEGKPLNGFAAAARACYGRELAQLSEDQFIALVGTLIAPEIFSPLKNPAMSQDRLGKIKLLLAGDYRPKGLCDLYYGKIPEQYRERLAPASYFDSYYQQD